MTTEKHTLGGADMAVLADMVGRELKSYCSDMDCPGRAFGVVVLRFAGFDLEVRIRELENESETEWIRDMTAVGVSRTSMDKVEPPSGHVDGDGNYIPNPFNSYPVGKRVNHVSVITEETRRDMGHGEGEALSFTRGIILDLGDSFIAFDKLESWGEVWTITTGTSETYCPEFSERDEEAPEFATKVEVKRIA